MKKIAVILGALALLAVAGNAFLYFRGDAYGCRKAGNELTRPADQEGWKHYVNCAYGFATDIPAEYTVVHEAKDQALFPFKEGELEQIVLTDADPEHAYTVRVSGRLHSAPSEKYSDFESATGNNARYALDRLWLSSETGDKIERSFVIFRPAPEAK